MKNQDTGNQPFDKVVNCPFEIIENAPKTLRDVIFQNLPHRNENCNVIYSHQDSKFLAISLSNLRRIICSLAKKLEEKGLRTGDTIMLASFSSSNELPNALLFATAVSMGIQVFVPIFPEPDEYDNWQEKTGFKCVVMPYQEMLQLKGHEREKAVIGQLEQKCRERGILFLDAEHDFQMAETIALAEQAPGGFHLPDASISADTEAIIFTTSGSSGVSKLLVYTHRGFVNCCQAWQQRGLFGENLFGNPGFSPLFTHTIGTRTFLHSIYSGNPFCIITTDWFLRKPEVVRYLLLEMQLGHIIGGPAFYNTLMELFRQYPELKTGLKKSLRAAISIGAPYDETTATKFKSATGISMMNGFGTTETLMVSLNNPGEGRPPKSLGMLMPGVTIGLRKTGEAGQFEMFLKSEFQATRTVGKTEPNDFFDTGDLVTFNEKTGDIIFQGRKSSDFFKDEYGVKIPLNALRNYYHELYGLATWIEWIPLVNIPGLAALLFLPAPNGPGQQKDLAPLAKNTNEQMRKNIEPFEYAHRHLERFSVVYDEVPLTRKGTVSKDQIQKRYGNLVAELRNPFVRNSRIEVVEPGGQSKLCKFSNPYLAELMEALKLDKTFVRAEGDFLFYQNGTTLQRVTDFAGGFGANLLGHNHPDIRQAVSAFLESGRPALNNQGSEYHYPALLAEALNRIFSTSTGKYFKVLFANSGTEATEMALHHAYFAWRKKIEKIRDNQLQLFGADPALNAAGIWDENIRRLEAATPAILVINNCFHGYTSGARSLLNPKKQRYLFTGLLRPRPLYISDTAPDWEQQVEKYIEANTFDLNLLKIKDGACVAESMKVNTIIASIIEPVRGEGGIRAIRPGVAEYLARQDFPLISDEIQCGMGRTGSFPDCNCASYYLLGKSLGGGFEKISAVLIDDREYKPVFAKYFNSTFANGELAACASLATLQIIERQNLTGQARSKGRQLLDMLHGLASIYPEIIESVSGKGLMAGIHFNPAMGEENNFLRVLFENEVAGYLFAGWLLHQHHVRVLPSLSKPNSIRIEPSVYLPESEMKHLRSALEELCNLCRGKKLYELCKFLMNDDPYTDKKYPVFEGAFPQKIEPPLPGAVQAGFVGNFTKPHRELQVLEPDFRQASDTGLRILFNRLQVLMEGKPFKIMGKNLMHGRVHFTFYILPFDTSQLEMASRWGKSRFFIAKIQEACDKLAGEGARCTSLGAHTSIITGNGLKVAERAPNKILTGNSLTVASCIYHLDEFLDRANDRHSRPLTVALVGAQGNIGSGLLQYLDSNKYKGCNFLLFGSSLPQLEKLRGKLKTIVDCSVCSDDLFELKNADAILCATNTNDPIIFPHHIHPAKPVFIIDISVPPGVSGQARKMENVHFSSESSSVYLQGSPDLLVSSHTPAGKIFCCAAESLLCALHGTDMPLKGHIQKKAVGDMLMLARQEQLFKPVQDAVPV